MARKQVDFSVRVRTLNAGGLNGGQTPQMLSEEMKHEYPASDGWELVSVQNIQLSADGVSVLLFFSKYADEEVEVKSKTK